MKQKKKILIIVSFFIISIFMVSVSYFWYRSEMLLFGINHPNFTYNTDEVKFVQTLKKNDGTVLGDIFIIEERQPSTGPEIAGNGNNIFMTLYVSKNIDDNKIILYKINKEGFFNDIGTEIDLSKQKNSFYGFQFALVADDHFVLHMLTDGGKGISDDLTIVWNDKTQVFEIERPKATDVYDDQIEIIQTLNLLTNKGTVEVSGVYKDKGKKIWESLYIVDKTIERQKTLYTLSEYGFSNTEGMEMRMDNNLFGYLLSDIGDDYIVVQVLADEGKNISNPIMIKWNGSKELFEMLLPTEN